MPKYLNSPESPIYSKSNVLYHMDRAKEALRRQDFAIPSKDTWMRSRWRAPAISNVVASCGTSLAEPQIKLLGRFTRRVNREITIRTSRVNPPRNVHFRCCWNKILKCACWRCRRSENKKADPDLFIRERGKDEYLKLLKDAPPYVDYLIARARQMGFDDGRREATRAQFPSGRRYRKSKTAFGARNGPHGSRNNFASMSRCCVRHWAKRRRSGAAKSRPVWN